MGGEPRDRVRAEARRLLAAGVSGRAFPGGVACVSWRDGGGAEELVEACAGTLEPAMPQRSPEKVREATRYDLGALTQSVVAVAALRLAAAGELELDAPVEQLVGDVRGGVLDGVTLRQLLGHRGGLARWGGLYLDVPHEIGSAAARRWLVSEAARRPLEPGEPEAPSDLGYLIAGEAIARAVGQPLDRVVDAWVLSPLGLSAQLGFPGALPTEKRAAQARESAPTERCEWRGRLVRGQVHDENAVALGGVGGHAGLFGTAHAVALFGRAVVDVLRGRSDFLPRSLLDEALAEGPGALRAGWQVKAGDRPACGRRMTVASFGQLGFTGTSIWCDPELDVVVVLLTNRVCPSRANEKIAGFRPAFHDGVLAALS